MTRRSRCLFRVTGSTPTGRLWVYVRDDRRLGSRDTPQYGSLTRLTAKAFIRRPISPDSRVSCRPTLTMALTSCMRAVGSARRHAGIYARWYIYDVHVRTPIEATRYVLELIGEFYDIDAHIRGAPPDERLPVRQHKSLPVLAALNAWMMQKFAILSIKSGLTKAIRYSLNQWDALVLYCEDGRIEISKRPGRKRFALRQSGKDYRAEAARQSHAGSNRGEGKLSVVGKDASVNGAARRTGCVAFMWAIGKATFTGCFVQCTHPLFVHRWTSTTLFNINDIRDFQICPSVRT